MFFDDDLMKIIVEETNRYRLQNNKGRSQKTANWYPTTKEEMYIFLATTMLMGINPKAKIKEYWSTDLLILTPIFSKMFTCNRYLSLLNYLHFSDNTVESSSRLRKLKTIIENLKQKFSNIINPFQNLCIDESLMLWKGRLAFRQYIPLKDIVLV